MSTAGLRASHLRAYGARAAVLGLFVTSQLCALAIAPAADAALKRETSSIQVAFDARQPGLSALSIDSLQRGEFGKNPIVEQAAPQAEYKITQSGGWVQYALASDPGHAVWQMRAAGDLLQLRSVYRASAAAMTWRFNPDLTHATLLGHVTAAGDIALPAVMHLPGMGSLRVSAQTGLKPGGEVALGYVAHRRPSRYVDVTFPAATQAEGWVEYTLRTAAIYPAVPGVNLNDRRYDGFRRDWLDIYQQQAEQHVLANNAASDAVGFTVFLYADMARYTPRLVPGLTAMDLVRDTLDSLKRGGFRRILIVNGHGGNQPAAALAQEWMMDNPDCRVRFHDWWRAPKTWAQVQATDKIASHASWMENFPWTRLPTTPAHDEKPMVDIDIMKTMAPFETRNVLEDGNYGGRTQRSDAEMQAIWDVAVAETRAMLEAW